MKKKETRRFKQNSIIFNNEEQNLLIEVMVKTQRPFKNLILFLLRKEQENLNKTAS